MKKLLSLLLVCCMLASIMALLPSFAEGEPATDFNDGTWTKITTVDEFKTMNKDGKYYLGNDLDFTDVPTIVEINGDEQKVTGWYAPADFYGTFDGNGFSLLNVTISSSEDTGVFGVKFHGTLQNVTIGSPENYASITCTGSGKASGAVAASIENGDATFTNVTVYCNQVGGNNKAGMFGGFIGGARTIVLNNCKTFGSISGGPVAGYFVTNQGDTPNITFNNCVNGANVDVSVNNATPCGGFYAVAWEGSSTNPTTLTFNNCVNNGNVTAKIGRNDRGCAAGFIGGNKNVFEATFTDCTNNGTIYGDNGSAGGVVAMRFDGNQDATNTFTLTRCVNNGEIKCESNPGSSAGLVAYPRGGSAVASPATIVIKDSINTGTVIGKSGSAGGLFTLRTDANDGSGVINVTVTGSVNVGSISAADWRAGGVVGMFGMNADSTLLVANCYNAGSVSNPGQGAAAIVGEVEQIAGTVNGSRVIKNCYNIGSINGNNTTELYRKSQGNAALTITNCADSSASAESALSTVMTDIDKNYATFVANSFKINKDYPILSWQVPAIAEGDKFSEGSNDYDNDTGKYVISTTGVTGFISARNNGDNCDIRFVLAADIEAIKAYTDLSVTVAFCDVTGVVKEFSVDFEDLEFYKEATGAGRTYVAAEGDALFGLIVTGVPNDAWDYVLLSVATSAETAMVGMMDTTIINP